MSQVSSERFEKDAGFRLGHWSSMDGMRLKGAGLAECRPPSSPVQRGVEATPTSNPTAASYEGGKGREITVLADVDLTDGNLSKQVSGRADTDCCSRDVWVRNGPVAKINSAENRAEHQRGDEAVSGDELLEVKPEFMGIQHTGYVGAFPPKVEDRIRKLVGSPCLHLFSGRSRIGDERVDFARPEATTNCDVFDFIKRDTRDWEWVVADPAYAVKDPESKLGYAKPFSVAADLNYRSDIVAYLQAHAENVLWFDQCIPPMQGFEWHKVWVYHLWSWGNIRALTWLRRKAERLEAVAAATSEQSAGAGANE